MLNVFRSQDTPRTLRVKVTANAKSERVKQILAEDGTILYKIYVTSVPEAGKANEAVIKVLSKALGVAKSSLSITHGITSREKIIKINLSTLKR